MRYPDYEDYRAMYQKYINRVNLLEMMDLVEDYKDKNFMDICAGDGAATREALLRGAKYSLVIDQESGMLATDLREGRDKIGFYNASIESFLYKKDPDFINTYFDVIFCRQGINYWYEPKHMHQLAKWMPCNSVFIFNTFNTKPSKIPTVKEYKIDNHHIGGPTSFAEISYLVADNIVHHVQLREGYAPHLTQFKYVSEEDFKHGLIGNFDYEIRRKNNTDVYICRKK
jgi:SAM-dependent methyltransferase